MKLLNFFKKRKKLSIFLIILLLALLISIFMPKPDKTPLVATTPLSRGEITKTADVSGKIEANDSAEITAPYNFKITSISVKEGDFVKAGQVLATLDSQSLVDEITLLKQDIAADEMRLNESYQELNYINKSTDSLKLNIENAKQKYEQAVTNLNRQKELLDAGAVAQIDYENAQNEVTAADMAVKQAEEALAKAQTDIQSQVHSATPKESTKMMLASKKTQLAQKQAKLSDLSIKSPIDGTVTRVYSKVGRLAQDTEDHKPMFVIEDESATYLSAKVGEYDISKVKEGQQVKITSNVLDKDSITGVVERISPTAEQKINSTSMVVPVKILVTQPDSRLITGVDAKGTITISTKNDIFVASFDSIGIDDDKNYIYTVENGSLKKIYVTQGLDSDFNVEIISNELKEGMPIVSPIEETYTDGMKVNIATENENAKVQTKTEEKTK